ncbi:Hypothetical protein FKW44_006876 [Caligus rogercresseyi]|uniref:Uncharacterized protein n=1 Tax=Caligus rogercresseyi TaxID=217165 RepID=A0A7T8KDZ7_CALRO|nr:Hypothetical protein FKW44_006876 [Caligus rogercresseyi]
MPKPPYFFKSFWANSSIAAINIKKTDGQPSLQPLSIVIGLLSRPSKDKDEEPLNNIARTGLKNF